MKEEKQLIENFEIEELENRFEMGRWVSSVKVGVTYDGYGVSAEFDV